MAIGRSNKIQVDVDLLADSAAKLEQFNADFRNNVGRLADLLSGGAGGTGGGIAGQIAGQLSGSASTSAGTDRMFQNEPTWATARGTMLGGDGGSGSYPSNDISNGGTPGGQSVQEEMVQFTRRVGAGESAIPVGIRQLTGYMAEGQQILPANPFSSSFWQPKPEEAGMPRKQVLARRVNDLAFQYQAMKANTMLAMGKYTSFFSGVQGLTNAGYSTNAQDSRHGILGSGLFSPAFFHGLGESFWRPALSSDFGLNPSYSMGQAQQARQAINQYGYSQGNMGDWLANTLKQNTIHYGLDPQTQMAFLDPMLRWGGTNFVDVNSALAGLASAATAAGYNTQQFAQELAQGAAQVSQTTGIPIGTAANGMSAISATTGLAPNQVAGLYNTNNLLMAAGLSGKSLGQVEFGNAQAGLLAFPLKNLEATLGMPIGEWSKWFHSGDPAHKKMAQDKMAYVNLLYSQNPQMFGNIEPMQLAHILAQAGSYKGYMHETTIQSSLGTVMAKTPGAFDAKIESMLGDYFRGNKSRDRQMVEEYIKQSKGKDVQDRRALAERLVRAYAPKDRRDTSKTMIGLTPQAQKLVQLMTNDPSHSNSGGTVGRLSSAGGAIADLASGNPVGAAESAWNAINPF